MKAGPEMAKNIGAGRYYESEAAKNAWSMSPQGQAHEIMKAGEPQRLHNEGMIALEKYKEAEREKNIEKMASVEAPPLMKRYGIRNMAQAYRVFGNDTGNVFTAMISAQASMAGSAAQLGYNNVVKMTAALNQADANLAKYKGMISPDEWAKLPEAEKNRRIALGEKVMTKLDLQNMQEIIRMKRQIEKQLYGMSFEDLAVKPSGGPVDLESLPSKGGDTSKTVTSAVGNFFGKRANKIGDILGIGFDPDNWGKVNISPWRFGKGFDKGA